MQSQARTVFRRMALGCMSAIAFVLLWFGYSAQAETSVATSATAAQAASTPAPTPTPPPPKTKGSAPKGKKIVDVMTQVGGESFYSGDYFLFSPSMGQAPFRPCADPNLAMINGWAVSGDLHLSSAVEQIGNTPQLGSSPTLVVAWCGEEPPPEEATTMQIVDPEGNTTELAKFTSFKQEQIYRYELPIDSPTGRYELLIPFRGEFVNLPLSVATSGRIFGVDQGSGVLRRRFASLGDVLLTGNGFIPSSAMTGLLVKLVDAGNSYAVSTLGTWQIATDESGSFTVPVAPELVSGVERAGGEDAGDSPEVGGSGLVGVFLCESDGCAWEPQLEVQPDGLMRVSWPALYATTICIDAVIPCGVTAAYFLLDITGQSVERFVDLKSGLGVELQVQDIVTGTGAADGVAYVDFQVTDEGGSEVLARRDEEAPFCLLEDRNQTADEDGVNDWEDFLAQRSACPVWSFAAGGGDVYTWPGGGPAEPGVFTIVASIVGGDGQVIQTVTHELEMTR